MPSEARLAERAEQVSQRLEAEEVETLVGDLELGLLRLAGLPANARLPRRVVRVVDRDVVFLLPFVLDEFLEQLVESAPSADFICSICSRRFSSNISPFIRACSIAASSSSSVLLALGEVRTTWIPESRSAAGSPRAPEQVLHAHLAGGVGHVFGVANAFHKELRLRRLRLSV